MSPISATTPAATTQPGRRKRLHEGGTAQGLQRLDDGTKRPFRYKNFNLLVYEILAFDGLIHGVEIGLKGKLLGGMGEALISEPNTMLFFQTAPG
jgi:hypothetical protein